MTLRPERRTPLHPAVPCHSIFFPLCCPRLLSQLYSFLFIHQRKFYVAPLGDDIRGEDRLIYTGEPGEIASEAIIRFHLHPRVRVSLIQNGSSALLRPQTGGGWRFRTDGGLNLEESIYYGSASRQKSEQIVVLIRFLMLTNQSN